MYGPRFSSPDKNPDFYHAFIQLGHILVLLFFSILLLQACGEDYSKATPFSLGDAIPTGTGSVRVAYVESTSQFSKDSSQTMLAICLDSRDFYRALQDQHYSARDLKSWLSLLSLTLVDSDGKKFGPGVPVRERDYRMMQAGMSRDIEGAWSAMQGETSGDNVVIFFQVPHKSQGFTLYLKNPWPQRGQAHLAAVNLRR